MTKVELRTSIKNMVNKLDDERLLKAYHTLLTSLMEEKEKSAVIGHSAKGEPLTKNSLIKKVKAASARVKSGKYISQEEVEKQASKW
jgi:hypothetical protein